MWVGVFTPAMVENKAEEVIRRLDETLKGENEDEVAAAAVADANVGSVTTTITSHHGPTMGEMMANLMKKVSTLEEKFDAKVEEIDGLKSENVALKTEIDVMKTKMTEMEAEIISMKGNKSS
jgi:hypothetical protein